MKLQFKGEEICHRGKVDGCWLRLPEDVHGAIAAHFILDDGPVDVTITFGEPARYREDYEGAANAQ